MTPQDYRDLAKQFEEYGVGGTNNTKYTCNAVRWFSGYSEMFGLGSGNEGILWIMSEKQQRDMRVLMLCFAAAMAETGDL